MNRDQTLDAKQRIAFTFRIEPGCLGPDGAEHIEGFCAYAQGVFAKLDEGFVQYNLIPRYDKSLPETEYRINGKALSEQQATLYLNALSKSLDEFEEQLQDRIAATIDKFLNR